ncbi:hypothetical protein B0H14DRAFT_3606096 [Mycena olivaceomarginata]|nr:hypothetical protein B0H14DRAFT_3606096 [Mycena olivaceomarginata]
MDDDDWGTAYNGKTSYYLGGELLLLNYLHLVGITVLYWDHLITLRKEITLLWGRGRSLSAYCFFVNRYFAFLTGIPVSVIPFLSPSTERCLRLSLFREMAIVLTQLITGVVMIIRVYALFGRSRRVLWFMVGTAACVTGVNVWSVSGQEGSRTMIEGGCHYGLTESTSYRLAGSWEALFAFDSLIFGLTIYYAYSAQRWRIRQTNLHTLVVRDGAMYFGIMALANLANISTYYLVGYWPFLPGALATFANCISVAMISRLILNLHEHADAGILTQPANRDSIVSIDDALMTEIDGDEQNRILNHLRSLHS